MTPAVGSVRGGSVVHAPVGLRDARRRREHAATAWRRDHDDHPDRDGLWRAYRTGALWNARHDPALNVQLQAALKYAEIAVPFPDPTAP